MSYYQAPMGDYKTYGYAGDPGFLSKLWKGFKKVARFIPGPIGAVANVAAAFKTPPIRSAGFAPTVQFKPQITYPQTVPMPGGGRMTRFGPRAGAYPGRPFALPSPAQMGAPGEPCPTGYHLAKDGSGRWVRNRRMNIANPRALRRAMRRVQGFEKLAKRTITFTRRTRLKKRKTS